LATVSLSAVFAISGFEVCSRHAATTFADISGKLPKDTPPSLMFGHDMFISMASIGESSNRLVTAA